MRRLAWIVAVVLAIYCATAAAAKAHPLYHLDATSAFDPYDKEAAWLKAHVNLITGYGSTAREHYASIVPTMDYHDAATEGEAPLTPATRAIYMTHVEADKAQGFAGVFNDDVNLGLGYRDGKQNKASYEPEAKELAALVAQERAFWPTGIIETNTQWHDLHTELTAKDPSALSIVKSTSLFAKEFGVGPTAGIGTLGDWEALLGFSDELQAQSKGIVFGGDYHNVTTEVMEYNLATELLATDGVHDYVGGAGSSTLPPTFWPGFNVSIGVPVEPRHRPPGRHFYSRMFSTGGGLFAGGVVIVNPPGSPTETLGPWAMPLLSVQWGVAKGLTLKERQGAVLRW
jgi:hypothetical protein